MDDNKALTLEEIFREKAEQRKVWAKAPFETKLQELLRMQHMHFVMKKAVGRKAPRPWNMSEEEYLRETSSKNEIP